VPGLQALPAPGPALQPPPERGRQFAGRRPGKGSGSGARVAGEGKPPQPRSGSARRRRDHQPGLGATAAARAAPSIERERPQEQIQFNGRIAACFSSTISLDWPPAARNCQHWPHVCVARQRGSRAAARSERNAGRCHPHRPVSGSEKLIWSKPGASITAVGVIKNLSTPAVVASVPAASVRNHGPRKLTGSAPTGVVTGHGPLAAAHSMTPMRITIVVWLMWARPGPPLAPARPGMAAGDHQPAPIRPKTWPPWRFGSGARCR